MFIFVVRNILFLHLGTFVLLLAYAFLKYLQTHLSGRQFRQLFTWLVTLAAGLVFFGVIGLTYTGVVAPWSGRFYSLYDTGWVVHIPVNNYNVPWMKP